MNNINRYLLLILGVSMILSCSKSEFLSAKPNSSLIVPKTLNDFQAILDNSNYMNGTGVGVVPAQGEASSDDYFVLSSNFESIPLSEAVYTNLYTWQDDLFSNPQFKPLDWAFAYRAVYYANVVLDGIAHISYTPAEEETYNNIKGSALFFRAFILYGLVQVFSDHYEASTAEAKMGIPLKLSGDISEKVNRPSLQETYDHIFLDLNTALSLLPDLPKVKTRPSKAAVYALMARINLSIGNYEEAMKNADLSLEIYDTLLDYNSLDPLSYSPIQRLNSEVVFHAILVTNNMDIINPFYARVDSVLYNTYMENDLRKNIFFNDAFTDFQIPGDIGAYFIGSYDGSYSLFAGLATDELFLIRAECAIRSGLVIDALKDLNTLMKNRWSNAVPFEEITATSPEDALAKILLERRKELIFRGLRWTDLRRLNNDGANISVKRILNGQNYTLSPDSKHYTFLIPQDVMAFNKGWLQNPR